MATQGQLLGSRHPCNSLHGYV